MTSVSCIQYGQRYDARSEQGSRGVVMRSKWQGQMANWQVRTWDVITVAVMLTMSVLGALWMVKIH